MRNPSAATRVCGVLLAVALSVGWSTPSVGASRETLTARFPAIDSRGELLAFEVCPTSERKSAPPCQVVLTALTGGRAFEARMIGDPKAWRYSDPIVSPDGRFVFVTRMARSAWRRRLSDAPSEIVRVDAATGAETPVYQASRRAKVLVADTVGERDLILVSTAGRFGRVVAPTSSLSVVTIGRASPEIAARPLEALSALNGVTHSTGRGVVFETAFPGSGGGDASRPFVSSTLEELVSGDVERHATIDEALEHVHGCSFAAGDCPDQALRSRILAAMRGATMRFLAKRGGDWEVSATVVGGSRGAAVYRAPAIGAVRTASPLAFVGVRHTGELRSYATALEAVRFAYRCDETAAGCDEATVAWATQALEAAPQRGSLYHAVDSFPPIDALHFIGTAGIGSMRLLTIKGLLDGSALAWVDRSSVMVPTAIPPGNRLRVDKFEEREPWPLVAEAEIDLSAVLAEAF